MNPVYSVVKEEYPSSGGGGGSGGGTGVQVPQPMEGLNDAGPPPFLTKIYDMVDDQGIDHIVCWSRGGQSFVVLDPHAFSTDLLPRYFKHNNFSSFVRQLNTYGFRKIDPDIWEFANEAFVRGQKHVLKNIKRRRAASQGIEIGSTFGSDEVDRLKHEKRLLKMELVKLKQQQQNTRAQIQAMEVRLQGTEKKQQKMMKFLAKAMQNPEFIQKLVQYRGESSQIGGGSKLIKDEPVDFTDHSMFRESDELETLALEIQGFGKSKRNQEKTPKFEDSEEELDDEFWEELFSEECVDDVNFLADKLDFLGSS